MSITSGDCTVEPVCLEPEQEDCIQHLWKSLKSNSKTSPSTFAWIGWWDFGFSMFNSIVTAVSKTMAACSGIGRNRERYDFLKCFFQQTRSCFHRVNTTLGAATAASNNGFHSNAARTGIRSNSNIMPMAQFLQNLSLRWSHLVSFHHGGNEIHSFQSDLHVINK